MNHSATINPSTHSSSPSKSIEFIIQSPSQHTSPIFTSEAQSLLLISETINSYSIEQSDSIPSMVMGRSL